MIVTIGARRRRVAATSAYALGVALLFMSHDNAYAQQPVVDASDSQAAEQLQEIVVTAQKRAENLQDVPIAVTALNTEAIDNAQITSFDDLDGAAPNLTVQPQVTSSQPVFSMRGIIGSNPGLGTDSAVATYVDGVYHARLLGAHFENDLERVEILRGPQGTLYGKNSTAGAINFITAKPKGEFYARQELTVGSDGKLRTKTRVDSPKFGAFSLLGTFIHNEIGGYARNSEAGLTWDFTAASRGAIDDEKVSPRKLGSSNSEALHIAVRYAPDSTPFTADYIFDKSNGRNTLAPFQLFGIPNTFAGAIANLVVALQPAGRVPEIGTQRRSVLANGFSAPERLTTWGHTLTMAFDLSDDIELKSITGYHGFTQEYITEVSGGGNLVDPDLSQLDPVNDAVILGILGAFFPKLGSSPGTLFRFLGTTGHEESKQFSQELQLSYDSHWLDAIVGALYTRENTLQAAPNFVAQPIPSNPPLGLAQQDLFAKAYNRSKAVFVQATGHITDEIDLTGGVRYTHDTRRSKIQSVIIGQDINPDFKKTFQNVSWMANLLYRPTQDISVYGKVSTGYLSGGVYNGNAFDPEKVTQYELGAKADLLDRRLRINAAVFHTDYKDLQIGQTNAQGIYIYQNAGKAKINGLELEVTAVPVRNVILTASYGYTDFEYGEYIVGGIDQKDNLKRQFTPKHSVSLGGDVEFGEFSNGIKPSFNLSARWHSKMFLAPDTNNYSGKLNEALRDNDAWYVDARATFADIGFGGPKSKFSFWVKNLLDKQKIQNAADLGFVVSGFYERGRTFGADFTVEF